MMFWIIVFCLIECALNARPLNQVSANISDLGAILANDLLFGNQLTGVLLNVVDDELNHLERYACMRCYPNANLSRWLKEYQLIWTVNLNKMHLPIIASKFMTWLRETRKATLVVSITLLGFKRKNSGTVLIALQAPPSYACCRDRASNRSVSILNSGPKNFTK